MSKQIAGRLIAILIVILYIGMLTGTLLATGCATVYHAERVAPDGTRLVIDVKSKREFKGGISILYNRDAGVFEAQAGEVTTGYSPLEQAAAGIITALPAILAAQPPQDGN